MSSNATQASPSVRMPHDITDLDNVWKLISSQHEPRSLKRVKRWVGSLVETLRGETPRGESPKDPAQRPRLLYMDGLEDSPWFDTSRFGAVAALERAFDAIHEELRADLDPHQALQFDSYFRDDPQGSWRVRKFYDNGERVEHTFKRYPTLGKILENIELPSDIGECQVSALAPGGRIAPHHGPLNGILVGHLAIRIPDGDCKIRVGLTARGWQRGRCLVFDDSFEHEVWNRTDEFRYVVLFNLWHPDLTAVERQVIRFFYPRCRDMLNAVDGT